METNTIKTGDYIVVQRQNYTKLHKLREHGTLSLGNFIIELDNVLGCKYFDTFRMILKGDNRKLYALEKVDEVNTVRQLNIEKSGDDNRNIIDDGESQAMTKDDILKLRNEDISSNDIVEQLITNSKTFASKTEYSQEKYLKKKEKKYFGYIQVRKPSLRLMAQMFYRQDPSKTQGMRTDDLSQILAYSNLQSEGNYVLYDSGTSGLVTAAMMNTVGPETTAQLIHMHPGNECQKNAFVAMQFPKEQADRCINVNLYSVLRCYYQNKDTYSSETNDKQLPNETKASGDKSETNDKQLLNETKASGDKSETNDESDRKETIESSETNASSTKSETSDCKEAEDRKKTSEDGKSRKRKHDDNETEPPAKKKPCWQFDNEKACKILKDGVDALVVVSKDHPVNIVKELVTFLKGGRNLVVFCLFKEPLQDLYVYLKTRFDFIAIKLSTNFMRSYQVLPDRTHPEVNMNSGGFVLTAVKLVN